MLDGWRGIAVVGIDTPAICSKQQRYLARFAALAAGIQRARGRRAVLDSEVACLDADGRPDFDALMSRRRTPVYATFDLPSLDGEDLRALPVVGRKRLLEEALHTSRTARYVSHVRGDGRAFLMVAWSLDFEGTVSKPADLLYVCDPSPWRKTSNPAYGQKTGQRSELFRRG